MSSQAAPKHVPIWRTEISLVLLIGCLLVFFIFPGTWSTQPALAPGQSIVVFLALLGVIGWGAFAVLRHAEVLAMLLGQPLGTLILTLSVILISPPTKGVMVTRLMFRTTAAQHPGVERSYAGVERMLVYRAIHKGALNSVL